MAGQTQKVIVCTNMEVKSTKQIASCMCLALNIQPRPSKLFVSVDFSREVKEQVTQKPVQVESNVRHSIDEPQGNVEDLGEKFFFCGVSKDNRGNRIPGKVF